MNLRSMLDQVKSAFVIGKDNTFLHGRQGSQPAWQNQEAQEDYAAPQQSYQPQYQQPNYQPPMQQQAEPWQQPQPVYPHQPPQQAPAWQQPAQAYQQQPQAPQAQASYQQAPPAWQPMEQGFQTQISPEPQPQRQRRAQQHQQSEQQAYQQQQPQAQAPVENVVQFPGSQPRQLDAYVINVFNINSCRQAMSCLRKGQCTLIVMDQLIDKAEIRRYVDMLTGACYALNGTKIGFYIMAPSGMTVYTDPTTTNANAQPKPQQAPLYRPLQPQMPQRGSGFAAQEGYQPPQMSFQQQAQQPSYAQEQQEQPQQYAAWQDMQPQYQAQ